MHIPCTFLPIKEAGCKLACRCTKRCVVRVQQEPNIILAATCASKAVAALQNALHIVACARERSLATLRNAANRHPVSLQSQKQGVVADCYALLSEAVLPTTLRKS
eukprot:IDg15191t1